MPRSKKIFVASSSAAINLARALVDNLRRRFSNSPTNFEFREWYEPETSRPSEEILQSIANHARECDFVIVLLTEDDYLMKKDQEVYVPRDNAIFELGLFCGAFGGDLGRCFMVSGAQASALPSDLAGRIRIKITQPPNLNDLKACRAAIEQAASDISERIDGSAGYEHPVLPLLSRDDLSDLEKDTKEGGKLVLTRGRIAVVVNSVEPVEGNDPRFAARVLKNMQKGARYEYFYGDFSGNVDLTIDLIVAIATTELAEVPAEWPEKPGQVNPPILLQLTRNLRLMQQNLSIHFRKRPPVQFCIHNAVSEEFATCYLRYKDSFVRWNEGWNATQIAGELTQSCTVSESDHNDCIFHSTSDVPLTVSNSPDVNVQVLVKARREKIVRSVKQRFPVDLANDLEKFCLGS